MEVFTFFITLLSTRQEGVVLLEILMVILLLSLLGMQSLAMFGPIFKSMDQSMEATQSSYAGLAILEMARKDAAFRPAYGEWDVSDFIPWSHPYDIILTRAVYAEWPELDQYTVIVGYNNTALRAFTTLIRPEEGRFLMGGSY
jgi:hypothetical protein